MSAHSMPTTRNTGWWLRRGAPAVLATFMVVFGVTGVAYAFYSSVNSDNFAAAAGDALPQGVTPTATATGTTVAINFAQVTTASGRSVATYKINRYSAGAPTTVAATFACTRSGTAPNCTETSVPAGDWIYTDTARLGPNWLGAESAKSASATVSSPGITSTNPASRGIGATAQVITITGSNFIAGTTATFSNGVTGTATYTNASTLTGTFDLAAATAGAATITVDNHNGTTATNNTAFTVIGIPTITSANPAAAARGTTNLNVTITGTNFIPGATATFSNGITVSNTAFTDATHLTATITVPVGATLGGATITVNDNDGGTTGSNNTAFTVTAPAVAPTISSTNPTSRGIGATNQAITITGANFIAGTTATFSNGITGTATYTNASTLTGTFNLAAATAGAATITVDNHNGTTATNNTAFTVTGVPTITSVAPNNRVKGSTNQSVVITGTNFVTGATAVFSNATITVNSTTVTDATHITANISLANATTGAGTVTVNNNNGGTGSNASAFTVTGAPTITSISPASMAKNSNASVTITGTNFVSGATVSFAPAGPTPSAITVVDATHITLTVTTAANDKGAYDLTVTNPDGGTVSTTNKPFTVN